MRSRTKILVVDDSPDFQMLVRAFLSATQYVVLSAGDTLQATGMALGEKPSLIVVDIGLPGGDGWVLLDRLKANTFTRHIPVIVVTGQTKQGLEEKAKTYGAADFLQKPIGKQMLLTALEHVFAPPVPLTTPASLTDIQTEPASSPVESATTDHPKK